MKSKLLIVILVLVSATVLFAGDKVLDYLHAESNGGSITITWKAVDETNVSYYSVQRSGIDLNFEEIATQNPKGNGTDYKYIDESALKPGDGQSKIASKTTYYYRIVLHNKDNSTLVSDQATVVHNTSIVHKTWGMLKEMFR